MNKLLADAEDFVRVSLSDNDASHDVWHVHRVRNMAKTLAKEEGLSHDRVQVVELAALLHDVGESVSHPLRMVEDTISASDLDDLNHLIDPTTLGAFSRLEVQ